MDALICNVARLNLPALLASILLGLATATTVHANSGGRAMGGVTCSSCHGGGSASTNVMVTTATPNVVAGKPLTFNVTVSNSAYAMTGAAFNSAVYNSSTYVTVSPLDFPADLNSGSGVKVHNFPGDGEFTQTGIKPPINGVSTFSFTWKTPPNIPVGTVYTLKTVGLAAPNDEWNTGNNVTITFVAPPPPPTVPGAPSGVSATAGNAQASVSFTAPSSDGGAQVTGYTVTALPGPIVASGPASPIMVTGLNNDTPYTFTVKAINSVGTGAASADSSAVTPTAPPDVATGVGAVAGDTQATVSFTAPSGYSGTYTVTAIPVGYNGSGPQIVTATGSSSPILVTGLTNNVSYRFTVTAGGAASYVSQPVMPNNGLFVPDPPSASGANGGNQMAVIAFSQPFNGGSPITAYNAICNYTAGVTLTFTASSPTRLLIITGLNNGTQYKCGLTATNDIGTSTPPDPQFYNVQFTPSSPNPPSVPTDITAVPGNGQVTIAFTPPANDGGSPILGYTASCQAHADFVSSGGRFTNVTTQAGSASPLTVAGLTNGAAYDCWVTANNSSGTFFQFNFVPNIVSVTPATVPVPGTPTAVSAAAGDAKALVSFTPPSSSGGSAISSYTVTSSPAGITASGTSSPIQITGLSNGIAYTFTVTATNSLGTGPASAASVAVTPNAAVIAAPDSPNCCSFVDAGNGMGILAFDPPPSNGSPITSYTALCTYLSGAGVTLSLTASGPASPLIITGLTNGTTYQCKLTATNAVGTSPVPTFATAQFTPVSLAPPGMPTAVSPTPGNGQATISFAAPANNGGSAILDYTAYCRDATTTFSTTGAGSPLTVTGLTNATLYACWVTARNAQGTFNSLAYRSPTVGVTPVFSVTIPAAPTGVSATFDGTNIILNWSQVSGATSYNVYMTNAPGVTKTNYASLTGGHVHSGVTATPFAPHGGAPGTTYYMVVTAVNSAGESADSIEFSVLIPAAATAPGAPTAVSASAGNAQATVSFAAPASNGGAAITSYTVTSSPGGYSASGAASPLIVTGLLNGTPYTFTVTATNSVGTGAASSASNSVTPQAPATVPGAPTSVSASPGNAQATVSFAAPASNGGAAITSYTAVSSPGSYSASGSASPLIVTGLANGTPYTFTVTATNSVGTGAPSTPSGAVTPNTGGAAAPDSPNCCAFVDAGNGMAILAFDPPANNGSPITSYSAICTYQNGVGVTLSLTASGPAPLLIIEGLTNGTAYQCKLTATNAVGTSPLPATASAQFTPHSPAPPSIPTAITPVPGNGQVTISFVPPANDGGSAILDYTASCKAGATTLTATGAASPLTITGLTNGTPYACWVTARNAQGTFNSLAFRSPTVIVTASSSPIVPVAPTGVSASVISGNNIQINWSAASGATSYNIYMANAAGITKANYGSLAGGHVHVGATNPYTHGGASPGTYYIVVTALNAAGESVESTQVSVTVGASVNPPGAPTSVSASPGNGQATISFAAPASNGGAAITSYTVTSSPGGYTASGSASPLTVTSLSNGTAYTFTVTATNSAGTGTASAASNSVTPSSNPTFTAALVPGFNLLGNSLNTTLNVMSIFGNLTSPVSGISDNIASVWKWDAANLKWQFHSPLLTTAANATYAASHNYDVLTSIAAGEGYWVNALSAMNLLPQTGAVFNWNSFSFANLTSGFNLIAHANNVTPSVFNASVSAVPPSAGVVPTDIFSTLWAWDASSGTWFFYSPLLESSGGLPSVKNYADSHFFQHFQDYNKKIDVGVGFWINKF